MKNAIKFSTLMVIFAIAIVGCSKEDKDNAKKLVSGAFNGRIVATVENSASITDRIEYVVASSDLVTSGSNISYTYLGDCEYKNGGFTLVLDTPEPKNLTGIENFFQNTLKVSGKVKYSNSSAKTTYILDFLAVYEHNGEGYATGLFRNKSSDGGTMCVFVYVDTDVDATAGSNITVSLKQGWNRLYYSSGKNMMTTKDTGDTKWYYTSN